VLDFLGGPRVEGAVFNDGDGILWGHWAMMIVTNVLGGRHPLIAVTVTSFVRTFYRRGILDEVRGMSRCSPWVAGTTPFKVTRARGAAQ
jgi:hypothetical protein